jgi:hypothetical protein
METSQNVENITKIKKQGLNEGALSAGAFGQGSF